jgi:hypothetical protein
MVELESGGRMSRAEVAAFLREFVDQLEGEGETVATGVEQGDRRSGETGRRTDTGATGRTEAETGAGTGTDADRTRRTREGSEPPAAGDAGRITFVGGGDSATVTIPEASSSTSRWSRGRRCCSPGRAIRSSSTSPGRSRNGTRTTRST